MVFQLKYYDGRQYSMKKICDNKMYDLKTYPMKNLNYLYQC